MAVLVIQEMASCGTAFVWQSGEKKKTDSNIWELSVMYFRSSFPALSAVWQWYEEGLKQTYPLHRVQLFMNHNVKILVALTNILT